MAVSGAVPDDVGSGAHVVDVQVDDAVLKAQRRALAADALEDDVLKRARHGADGHQLVLACCRCCSAVELEHRRLVLRAVLAPVLGLDGERGDVHDIGLVADVEDDARAEAQLQRAHLHRAHMVLAAGIDGGVIVGGNAGLEVTAVADECRVAVQPNRRRLHDAVELERTVPHIGSAGMLLRELRQHENALALLHKTGGTAEGAASERRGKGLDGAGGLLRRRGDSLLGAAALHPCRGIDS